MPPDKQSDAFFKIFYSDIRPARIALLGLNPGGDPLKPPHYAASLFYENNDHDYVDCSYRIATKMRDFLLRSGIAPALDGIRAIPKFNVIFHRSPLFEELSDPPSTVTPGVKRIDLPIFNEWRWFLRIPLA